MTEFEPSPNGVWVKSEDWKDAVFIPWTQFADMTEAMKNSRVLRRALMKRMDG